MVLKAIRDGERPFLVALTAGTTVFGAFDPIDEMADICKRYNMWLHVDVIFEQTRTTTTTKATTKILLLN